MEQLETAQRPAGCSFGGGGGPFWDKLMALMEQLETAQRPAGCSFGVGGGPFWDKLMAPIQDKGRKPKSRGMALDAARNGSNSARIITVQAAMESHKHGTDYPGKSSF